MTQAPVVDLALPSLYEALRAATGKEPLTCRYYILWAPGDGDPGSARPPRGRTRDGEGEDPREMYFLRGRALGGRNPLPSRYIRQSEHIATRSSRTFFEKECMITLRDPLYR